MLHGVISGPDRPGSRRGRSRGRTGRPPSEAVGDRPAPARSARFSATGAGRDGMGGDHELALEIGQDARAHGDDHRDPPDREGDGGVLSIATCTLSPRDRGSFLGARSARRASPLKEVSSSPDATTAGRSRAGGGRARFSRPPRTRRTEHGTRPIAPAGRGRSNTPRRSRATVPASRQDPRSGPVPTWVPVGSGRRSAALRRPPEATDSAGGPPSVPVQGSAIGEHGRPPSSADSEAGWPQGDPVYVRRSPRPAIGAGRTTGRPGPGPPVDGATGRSRPRPDLSSGKRRTGPSRSR